MLNAHSAVIAIAIQAMAVAGLFAESTPPPSWDTYSDTWVATDDLGRSLPTYDSAEAPKPNHTVGIFYYLWLPGARADHAGPFDNQKIMSADPDALSKPSSPLWGSRFGFQHWGEPVFGYYRIFDDYVLRKHAQMLTDAGVDVVLFDTTNSYNYFDQVAELAKVWSSMQSLGQKVPQFVFTCRAGAGDRQAKQVQEIYDTIYKDPKYSSLWFDWSGKPLIIATPDKTRMSEDVLRYFTFRSLLWPGKPLTPAMWSLDNSLPYSDGNDRLGVDADGKLEEMAAAVAVSNAGGPMSTLPPVNSRAWRGRKIGGHLETDVDASKRGGQFQDEFDFLLARDPKFCLIYCWNEWVAQKFVDKKNHVYIVDEFNEDHSKDIEPMLGGHGDDYFYQMIDNIRRYRGVRPLPSIHSAPIHLDGTFEDWMEVAPEYRDTLGDPAERDSDAFGSRAPHYTNTTGRNDLKSAKISVDATRVYFLIRTVNKLSPFDPAATIDDWMTLYIDSDHDSKTGWLGYDLRVSPGKRIIETNVGGKYEWKNAKPIDVAIGSDGVELSIPRSMLKGNVFDFKWSDHCYEKGDWTDFTLNGDAAPNDRFNYRAILP